MAAALALAAAGCLIAAANRRNALSDVARPLVEASESERAFNVFSPVAVGQPYLWLGAGMALGVSALVLLAGSRWRGLAFPWLTALLLAVAVAGFSYAAIEHDNGKAALATTGAYVSVYGDSDDQDAVYYAPVFEPFNWRSPYLALGLAAGLLVGSTALAGLRRRAR